ncbi:MAG: SH3 domain-containing protein [Eubacteriales bacterium]|nr:SH3 domain-containing protein [Eubacteriales bacterium]
MNKRLSAVLLLTVLLVGMLPLSVSSALIGPQYVSTANGKGLYLRSGPSKDYDILVTIPYGAMVDSYEYYDGTWGYVSYNGYYGYCMARYLSSEKPGGRPSPSPTSTPSGGDLYRSFVKADYYVVVRPSTPSGFVNLRWAPSKNQAIEGTYYAGYTLRVTAQNGEWAMVYDADTNTSGFMMRAFLNATGDGVAW